MFMNFNMNRKMYLEIIIQELNAYISIYFLKIIELIIQNNSNKYFLIPNNIKF